MKSTLIAAATLLMTASFALAQAPAPEAAPTAPAAPAPKAIRKAAPARVAAPVAKPTDAMEIAQIVAIRQVDPTTYEIDAKAANGAAVNLRMNVFVMQDLGRQLGTYGKAP